MKAFWVIGDLGVITSNQQIKRDGIQEENFFSQQHNLPTKNDGLTHFISILILYMCILSDQGISRILVETGCFNCLYNIYRKTNCCSM